MLEEQASLGRKMQLLVIAAATMSKSSSWLLSCRISGDGADTVYYVVPTCLISGSGALRRHCVSSAGGVAFASCFVADFGARKLYDVFSGF